MFWRLIDKLEARINRMSERTAKAICLIFVALVAVFTVGLFYFGIPF